MVKAEPAQPGPKGRAGGFAPVGWTGNVQQFSNTKTILLSVQPNSLLLTFTMNNNLKKTEELVSFLGSTFIKISSVTVFSLLINTVIMAYFSDTLQLKDL